MFLKTNKNLVLFVLILVFWSPMSIIAQDAGMYDESDIQLQTDFISAHQLKYLGKSEDAIKKLKEVLSLDQEHHAASYEIAKIYKEQGDILSAIKYAKKANQHYPNDKWYTSLLAQLYIEDKDNLNAIAVLEKLILLDPKEKLYYEELAYAHLLQKQSDNAIIVLNQMEALFGIKEGITKKKFDIYLGRGDTTSAKKELEKLYNSSPKNVRIINNYAAFLEDHGEEDTSYELYQKVLTLEPENSRANLAVSTFSKGNKNPEANTSSDLLGIISNKSIHLDDKIKLLIPVIETASAKASDSDLANKEILVQALLDHHDDQARANAIVADYYFLTENSKSENYYKKAIEQNDNIYAIWKQLMQLYFLDQNWNSLQKLSFDAMDLFPNQLEAYSYNLKSNIELSNNEEVNDILDEYGFMSASNDYYKIELALIELRKAIKQNQNVNTKLDKIKIADLDYLQLEELGDLYRNAKKINESKTMYQNSIKAGNNSLRIQNKLKVK